MINLRLELYVFTKLIVKGEKQIFCIRPPLPHNRLRNSGQPFSTIAVQTDVIHDALIARSAVQTKKLTLGIFVAIQSSARVPLAISKRLFINACDAHDREAR